MAVPVFSIVARSSGTGKTTVMEKLIAELSSRGWKVGAIKNAAEVIHFDQRGKDSWRFQQAGAQSVAVITEKKYAVVRHTKEREIPQNIMPALGDVDLVIIEGYKEARVPKVEVVRSEVGKEIITAEEELLAVVTDVRELETTVPVFSFDETSKLADFVEERLIRPQTCAHDFSHFDSQGRARMVDVTGKDITEREAVAQGQIHMARETLALIKAGKMAKGDVLAVAQVAAVMGVKETSRLIPMCHPLLIGGVAVDFELEEEKGIIEVTVRVKITGQTGVEMEALTGVNVALLTIYDMCKAVDKSMSFSNIRLLEKKGGRSGHYIREEIARWAK